jgi:hypothetical protein
MQTRIQREEDGSTMNCRSKIIMIVSLTVNQGREAEFTRFYQHEFLPATLRFVPEFVSVRRFEVCGELRWNRRRTLSIYEAVSEEEAQNAFVGFSRPALTDMVEQFARWKDDFSDFSRVLFKPVYEHSRSPLDGEFGNRPLFISSVELKPELGAGFLQWMRTAYLPRAMSDVPSLLACRQYVSIGTDPMRYVTLFECQDEAALTRALADLGAPHRYQENESLANWENLAVDFHESCSYRQTYRYPD